MWRQNRYCSPAWNEEDKCFIPEDWSVVRFSAQVRSIIDNIRANILDETVPIFVRGSLIEERQPHPKSDIDVLYIANQSQTNIFTHDIKLKSSRPLDINPYYTDVLEPRDYLLPLIHIRSFQIAGPYFERRPFDVTQTFYTHLWRQYRIDLMPPRLSATGLMRVMYLKHLFRSIGLVMHLQGGRYSRDIRTCIAWLIGQEPELGTLAEQIWMERTGVGEIWLRPLRDWVIFEYNQCFSD